MANLEKKARTGQLESKSPFGRTGHRLLIEQGWDEQGLTALHLSAQLQHGASVRRPTVVQNAVCTHTKCDNDAERETNNMTYRKEPRLQHKKKNVRGQGKSGKQTEINLVSTSGRLSSRCFDSWPSSAADSAHRKDSCNDSRSRDPWLRWRKVSPSE